MSSEVRVPCDFAEVIEAAQVLTAWRARAEELPQPLRAQLAVLALAQDADLVTIAQCGGVFEAQLSPFVRALVANLRARG